MREREKIESKLRMECEIYNQDISETTLNSTKEKINKRFLSECVWFFFEILLDMRDHMAKGKVKHHFKDTTDDSNKE